MSLFLGGYKWIKLVSREILREIAIFMVVVASEGDMFIVKCYFQNIIVVTDVNELKNGLETFI